MFSIFKSIARFFKNNKKTENSKDRIDNNTHEVCKLFDLAMKSACRGEITIKYWPSGDTIKSLTEDKVVKGKEDLYKECIRGLNEIYKEIKNEELKFQKAFDGANEKNINDYWDKFEKYFKFLSAAIGYCLCSFSPHPEEIEKKLSENFICESRYRSGEINKLDQNQQMEYESRISEHIAYQNENNSLKSVDSLEKLLRFHVCNFNDKQKKILSNFTEAFSTFLESSNEESSKTSIRALSDIYKNFSEVGVSSRRRFWNKQLRKAVNAYRGCIDHHLEKCEKSINFYLENLENEVVNLGLTFPRQWPGGSGEFEKFAQSVPSVKKLKAEIEKLENVSNELQSNIQNNDLEKIREKSESYRNACSEYFKLLGKLFKSLFGSDKKINKIGLELYKNLNFEINSKLGYSESFKPNNSECRQYEQKLFNNIINQKTVIANSLDRFEYLLKFHFGDSFNMNKLTFDDFAKKFNKLVNDVKSYNSEDFNEALNDIFKTFCEKRGKLQSNSIWNNNLKKLLESYKSFVEDYYNQEVGSVQNIKK